jgi:DNA-binding winged helix-turn-helix (wHTH) protein/tetratricopeptide (TPR) repeat protein
MTATDSSTAAVGRYRFAGMAFDAERGLEHDGQWIPLGSQERRLLAALLAAEGRVVSKEALVREVWRGTAVSDDSISSAVFRLRRALASAGARRAIATVYSGGFRIAVAVTRVARDETGAPSGSWTARPNPVVRDYLQTARELVGRRGLHDLVSATLAARRATGVDPRSVEAWVLLAQICVFRINRGQVAARQTAIRRAEHALRHALAVDPNSGAALALQGWILAVLNGDMPAGLALLNRAEMLDSGEWTVHMLRAWALYAARRPQDGLAAFEAMMQRNPLATVSTGSYGYALGCAGRLGEARALLDRAVRQTPTIDSILSARSAVAVMAGDLDLALLDAQRCAEVSPDVPNQLCALACAHAARGETLEAKAVLERMLHSRCRLAPSWHALTLATLGERDAAAAALRRAKREGCTWLAFVQYDPRLRAVDELAAIELGTASGSRA